MNTELDKLKEDIIERYNLTWTNTYTEDSLGIIQAAKDNFKDLVEKLMFKSIVYGKNMARPHRRGNRGNNGLSSSLVKV